MWCADWGMVPDTIADLAVALQGHMMRTGQWSEWEICLHKVLDRIRPHISDARRYELQHCLATLCFRLHRLDDAIACWPRTTGALHSPPQTPTARNRQL